MSVWIPPVVVSPLKTVTSLPTFKAPPKLVSKPTPNPPLIMTDPLSGESDVCVLLTRKVPSIDISPVLFKMSVWAPPRTCKPLERVVISATFKAPPKLTFIPTPKPPFITVEPVPGEVEFKVSLTVKSLVVIDVG